MSVESVRRERREEKIVACVKRERESAYIKINLNQPKVVSLKKKVS